MNTHDPSKLDLQDFSSENSETDKGAASSSRTSRPGEGSRPKRRASRGRRRRPIPPDIIEADKLEDGHDRVIDPVAAGAEVYNEHELDPKGVDENALKVVRRLRRYGFQVYLVGGCVRDLLLGITPKDFDIATSATPRQIRKLFRNSRVIGRRFRLVHIHFGDQIHEVSTFRREAPRAEGDDPLIRRDNVFGRADEDALRRDFTCNALFYDADNNQVIDFVGGMRDVRKRRIVMIGDPRVRLREDPVRMLRAVKFAGRLRLEIAQDLFTAIQECCEDLEKCAAPRLFEELTRLMSRGGAYGSFVLLRKTGLMKVLIPEVSRYLDENENRPDGEMSGAQRFWNSLRALDRFTREGRPLSHIAALGALFCHFFDRILLHTGPPPEGERPIDYDIGAATEQVLRPLAIRLQMPRRDLYRLKQVIIALRRMVASRTSRKKPSPSQFVRKEYFPDALQLLRIYSHAVGRYQGDVVQWERRYEQIMGSGLE